MGPEVIQPGQKTDVKPHPHIGLSTVTYLFEGELHHRDSLGSSQVIRSGDVNWMTAGSGIVHSERMTEATLQLGQRLHGIQIWVALPTREEECPSSFRHYPGGLLPRTIISGCPLRWIAGEAMGLRSPVETKSPLFYLEGQIARGQALKLPRFKGELGVYCAVGLLQIDSQPIEAGAIAVMGAGDDLEIHAPVDSRFLLLGGAPLEGPRLIWWNFVSSSRERLVQAREDWLTQRFPKIPGDDLEFVPAPKTDIPAGIR
jgi:redox-sensitive bicupin YhaK (pirin superfamily)